MGVRVVSLLLLGFIAIAAIAHVHAYGEEREREEGWLSSIGHRVSSWMPWTSKLGSDHVDTLHKVEEIYQRTHEQAQERVDQLKESKLRGDKDVQSLIADIYHEEAQRAEREIEALKHPMSEWLLRSRSRHVTAAPETSGVRGMANRVGEKFGEKFDDLSSKAKSEAEELSSKVVHGYRSALQQAKDVVSTASSATTGAVPTWEEAKDKAAKAYSDAFHTGHGQTRTLFGRMRDTVGRGVRGTADVAKAAARGTWDLITHSIMAAIYLLLGGLSSWGLFTWWRKRRFNKQLTSHVVGPIIAVGEYLVIGNDECQRKFYDYWSGPAANYFQRQPGMRRTWMHRGVGAGNNQWLSYSEWATIEDLRRACRSQEFEEIKKRAPKASAQHMTLYQLGSSGARYEGEAVDANKDKGHSQSSQAQTQNDASLRQRGTTTTTTATQHAT